jgi:mRNA-degrading endonuclease toxin of MazEF toxin-antitoxin module
VSHVSPRLGIGVAKRIDIFLARRRRKISDRTLSVSRPSCIITSKSISPQTARCQFHVQAASSRQSPFHLRPHAVSFTSKLHHHVQVHFTSDRTLSVSRPSCIITSKSISPQTARCQFHVQAASSRQSPFHLRPHAVSFTSKLRTPGLWHAPVRERAGSSTDRKVVFA